MAPADDADTAGIDLLVLLQHPLPRGMDVLDLPSAIIDQSPKIRTVATAAPVIRSDNRVALAYQIAHHMGLFIAHQISVNLTVSENDQRQLAPMSVMSRDKGQC